MTNKNFGTVQVINRLLASKIEELKWEIAETERQIGVKKEISLRPDAFSLKAGRGQAYVLNNVDGTESSFGNITEASEFIENEIWTANAKVLVLSKRLKTAKSNLKAVDDALKSGDFRIIASAKDDSLTFSIESDSFGEFGFISSEKISEAIETADVSDDTYVEIDAERDIEAAIEVNRDEEQVQEANKFETAPEADKFEPVPEENKFEEPLAVPVIAELEQVSVQPETSEAQNQEQIIVQPEVEAIHPVNEPEVAPIAESEAFHQEMSFLNEGSGTDALAEEAVSKEKPVELTELPAVLNADELATPDAMDAEQILGTTQENGEIVVEKEYAIDPVVENTEVPAEQASSDEIAPVEPEFLPENAIGQDFQPGTQNALATTENVEISPETVVQVDNVDQIFDILDENPTETKNKFIDENAGSYAVAETPVENAPSDVVSTGQEAETIIPSEEKKDSFESLFDFNNPENAAPSVSDAIAEDVKTDENETKPEVAENNAADDGLRDLFSFESPAETPATPEQVVENPTVNEIGTENGQVSEQPIVPEKGSIVEEVAKQSHSEDDLKKREEEMRRAEEDRIRKEMEAKLAEEARIKKEIEDKVRLENELKLTMQEAIKKEMETVKSASIAEIKNAVGELSNRLDDVRKAEQNSEAKSEYVAPVSVQPEEIVSAPTQSDQALPQADAMTDMIEDVSSQVGFTQWADDAEVIAENERRKELLAKRAEADAFVMSVLKKSQSKSDVFKTGKVNVRKENFLDKFSVREKIFALISIVAVSVAGVVTFQSITSSTSAVDALTEQITTLTTDKNDLNTQVWEKNAKLIECNAKYKELENISKPVEGPDGISVRDIKSIEINGQPVADFDKTTYQSATKKWYLSLTPKNSTFNPNDTISINLIDGRKVVYLITRSFSDVSAKKYDDVIKQMESIAEKATNPKDKFFILIYNGQNYLVARPN